MKDFTLPYGQTRLSIHLPDRFQVDLITPKDVPGEAHPSQAVQLALEHPLGAFRPSSISRGTSVAIAVNDKTRPVPHATLLPPLLAYLHEHGVLPQHVTLIVASGTHTPMPAEEYKKILPEEILQKYTVVSHDCDDEDNLVPLGTTSRGTSIRVNRTYMQADLRVVVGDIEPHHFMGFSGGVKSAAIGLAGRETINANHAMLPDPNARTGHYADNPMRQDVEEIGEKIGVHLALNAILNRHKHIVRVLAGDPLAVMGAGIPLSREICQVSVPAPYDLVIAAPGGHPKDINLYQSQKGITNSAAITRDGGAVVLAAACPEGPGSQKYERWMNGVASYQAVFERFRREGFQVGPHKAFQIARDASRVRVILVSQMPAELVRKLLLEPAPQLQAAVDALLAGAGPATRIAVMPQATVTIPVLPSPPANA